MTVWRQYVYKSRFHRLEQELPPNVEHFLVELFQEPRRYNPSDKHEKLQAAIISSWAFLIKVMAIKMTRMATPLFVIFPKH
jgi:hypothetical protein